MPMHPSTIARIDHERSGNAKSNRERIASVIRSTTILLTAHEISEKCGINSVEVTRRLNEIAEHAGVAECKCDVCRAKKTVRPMNTWKLK